MPLSVLAVISAVAGAVIFAAWRGHDAVVKLPLEIGADIESKDGAGRTALLLAAESGHKDLVKLLLESGAAIDSKDYFRRTALSLATENRHVEVVKLLRFFNSA